MTSLLPRPTRPRLILAVALALALLAVAGLLVLAASRRTHPVGAPTNANTLSAAPPTIVLPAPIGPSSPGTAPSSAITGGQARLKPLPHTPSADVYAAAVATALWDIDYPATDRTQLLAFWRQQLATAVPAGLPAGTTLAQTQDAAMSTLQSYLPTAAMWTNLSRDHTVSRFMVTAVSEPPSWVTAIAGGQITDPGLTARTVLGVQTITYGVGTSRRTTSQSQQLTVALLCPPTTGACSVEIIPPTDTAGVGG